MLAVRCGGGCGGAGAYLTAQRTTAARSGDGRGAVLSAGTGARGRSLRVSFSPNSRPHRVGASCPWPVKRESTTTRLANTPERRVSKKKRDEAWEALKTEFGRMFRPQLRNLGEIFSLRSVYDLEDYQIGMLFGAFLGCVGCYQLWKTAPSIFVDAVLAFIFYKLSVVSSELHRSHKSNSLITRLKFGTILIMVWKDIKKNYVLLDVIRMPVFLLYICAFLFDVAGVKNYGRRGLVYFVNLLKTRGGIQEIYRIMWLPGYISPYDDGLSWL